MKLTVYKVGETQISATLEVAPGIFRSGVFALADIAGYPGDLPAARQWIIDHLPAYQPGQAITPDGDIITPTLTAAEFRAAVIQVLKTLSDAVIDGRDLGHQNEARAIMYLRDVAIR